MKVLGKIKLHELAKEMNFDEQFLKEVGLSAMRDDEKKAFLAYAQEELEIRVGEEVAVGLTKEEGDEFEALPTDEEARDWLEKNKPNYREIVKATIDSFKAEIVRNRDKILN